MSDHLGLCVCQTVYPTEIYKKGRKVRFSNPDFDLITLFLQNRIDVA